MIQLVYSPRWFYGKDIIIDVVSIFVLFLIAFFSIKYYKINKKNKNYLLLATSFILMALSFLFKIITNFTIYYRILETRKLGFMTFTYDIVKSSNVLFFAGFLMHRILMLLGLYMLYSIYLKQNKFNIFLIAYLILISTYFSRSAYYIFHLTSLIFLIIITLQYFKNYKTTKHKTNKWLAYSFSVITASQIVFVFIKIHTMYVIAELIQFVGYVGLLITFIKVVKDGKKKRKK
jgi:hypothetical protein